MFSYIEQPIAGTPVISLLVDVPPRYDWRTSTRVQQAVESDNRSLWKPLVLPLLVLGVLIALAREGSRLYRGNVTFYIVDILLLIVIVIFYLGS